MANNVVRAKLKKMLEKKNSIDIVDFDWINETEVWIKKEIPEVQTVIVRGKTMTWIGM